jgi:hypothetical protein
LKAPESEANRVLVVAGASGSSRSELAAEIDQLRLRDLHDRRAVERGPHVEPHAIGVLVVRALVLDRAEPAIERIAERALVIDGGGKVARLDPALRDSVLLFGERGFAA